MSLLLDALKRAEQEKLARQEERTGGARPGVPASRLELEAVEVARAAPASTPAPDRGGVQAAFAAKQPRRAIESEEGSNTKPILIGAGVVLLLIAAGGGYFWYQLAGLAPKNVAASRSPIAPRPMTPAPLAPAPPALAAGSASGLVTPAAPGAGAAPSVAPPLAMLTPGSVSPESRKSRPAAGAAEQLVMELLRESPAQADPAPLKLARTLDAPRVHPDVALGYDALRRGDVAAARRSYQAALDADRGNVDAFLGLATAEARAGERALATRHYRRALELDPRNATALAGLAALADLTQPQVLEPQLKNDVARYPESAALRFTLGNLYASQSRWGEAQAAFFEAHRLEPGNADILYNLAVSLDQLGQAKLASDHYRQALAATRGAATQFDVRAVERRLAEIKR